MDDSQGGDPLRLSRLLVATLVLALAGCTSAKQMTTPDGRQGYTVGCSGSVLSWEDCFERADEICKGRNYDVFTRVGEEARLLPLNRSTSTTIPRTPAVWSLPARGLDHLSAPGASRGRLLIDSPPAGGLHTRSLTTVPELPSCTIRLTTLRPQYS